MEPNSNTLNALKRAAEGAQKAGAVVDIIQLRDYQIPILFTPFSDLKGKEDAEKLKNKLREAQGFLLASPEYHGSVSGALKNALDHMGFDEFEGKMAGIIGLAGGVMGAGNALNHLRTICRQLHAWVVPGEVSIPISHDAFAPDGSPKDSKLADRLERLGTEVARFAMLHNQEAWKEFVKLWEKSVQNPGGEDR